MSAQGSGLYVPPKWVEEDEARRIRDCLYAEHSGAELSADGRHRWTLWRVWDHLSAAAFVVIGLNPSTADATTDDPTIRRCIAFARREGCGRLVMLNLYGFRATDPKQLPSFDPAEATNFWAVKEILEHAKADYHFQKGHSKVVAAWGANPAVTRKNSLVADLYPGMLCLGKTSKGHPRHPLYLRADTPLEAL